MIVIHREKTGALKMISELPEEEIIVSLSAALVEVFAASIPGKERAAFLFGELCGEMHWQIQETYEEKEGKANERAEDAD